ncbi:MAG TPA: response regulator [Chthoniobacterales bacterium]
MKHDSQSEQLTESDRSDASRRPGSRTRRIMVVDDDPAARVLAKRIFTEAGFEVSTGQSGFECLEKFRKAPNSFDLIVLDLSMPFMDGEETFRHLRAIKPNVVVLLSTGFLTQAQDRIDRMLAAGMAGFIRKPHRPDELLAQVYATLQRVKISRVGAASDLKASV